MSTEAFIAVAIAVATALPALFVVLRNWLFGRRVQRGMKVRLEIDGDTLELSGVTSEEQAKLLDAWLKLHDLDKGAEERDGR